MNNPTRLPCILAATILAVLTCNIAAVSFASDSFDDLQVKVKFADLDISSASGAAVLYMRIQGAAEAVCRQLKNPDLYYRRLFLACVRKAISKAIDEVNQPVLYTIAKRQDGTH
jgi:UrcA family protein